MKTQGDFSAFGVPLKHVIPGRPGQFLSGTARFTWLKGSQQSADIRYPDYPPPVPVFGKIVLYKAPSSVLALCRSPIRGCRRKRVFRFLLNRPPPSPFSGPPFEDDPAIEPVSWLGGAILFSARRIRNQI
jgi:hypothetical protein